MITIKTKKFNINRISKYMPIKNFHTQYEAYNGEDVYDYIEYFQNVLELKEIFPYFNLKRERTLFDGAAMYYR